MAYRKRRADRLLLAESGRIEQTDRLRFLMHSCPKGQRPVAIGCKRPSMRWQPPSPMEFVMALTQMQIIQSLGEAMAWFERELQWGVPPTELRHLCGRIGELYAALITNGQMAVSVNQKGYDVVSAHGEKVSVKTTAKMDHAGYVSFNPRSLSEVDRVIILRINTDDMEVETLLDVPLEDALAMMGPEIHGKRSILLSRLLKRSKPQSELVTVNQVSYLGYVIKELESGTIAVLREGQPVLPAKPALREMALNLNIALVNSNGNPLNTRQLGSLIIQSVKEIISSLPTTPAPIVQGSSWPG